MAVSRDEVLHIAALARFKLDEKRVDLLARELSSILGHIEVLSTIDTTGISSTVDPKAEEGGTPLRDDAGPPAPLASSLESFAPEMKGGFFIVPRLATHEDSPELGA